MKFYDDDDDVNEICQNQSNLDLNSNLDFNCLERRR